MGQGDGCLVVASDSQGREKLMLVDAGEGDNMARYLKWRFGKFRRELHFYAAVITHPDQDHYQGFAPLFEQPQLHFENVFHNGLGERAGALPFGPLDSTRRFVTNPVVSHADAQALYGGAVDHGRMQYPALMRTALTSGRVGQVKMLSNRHGELAAGRSWLPGFGPTTPTSCSIEVLGPVVESTAGGAPRLRVFGPKVGSKAFDKGKTKNGHSVLLRLQIGHLTLMLGGDLNRPAEDFLLRHYGQAAAGVPLQTAVAAARLRLGCDVMKSCHHGSSDVTDEFLQAANPFAFVVSSGDAEGHVHPRPDLLGRLGKQGRGANPLLLCTELQRSSREREDPQLMVQIRKLDAAIEAGVLKATAGAATEVAALRAQRAKLQDRLMRRNVEVYGAINLRTDGQRLVLAFMVEAPKPSSRWHTYWFDHSEQGGWVLQ